MIEKPKVCTKNGEWIELTEEVLKERSLFDKKGQKLSSLTENPEKLKRWVETLRTYNSEVQLEKDAAKEADTSVEEDKEEDKLDYISKSDFNKWEKYIKKNKLKVEINKKMTAEEIVKIVTEAEEGE